MRLRQLVFWPHLAASVAAGSVIFVMSVTGVLLAFERQIVAFAEGHARTIQPPAASAPRLGPDALVIRAREAVSAGTPTGVTLSVHPAAAALIGFGRARNVFVDPYTGAVLGEGATALRGFFHTVTDWHRWLGTQGASREIGRSVTGACNAAFAVLVIAGFCLWWPRRWTRTALRAATVPSLKPRGKPRDWNWHNAVGFWSAPVLFCITLTGVVMSYQWADSLIFTLTGSEPPPMDNDPSPAPPARRVLDGVDPGQPFRVPRRMGVASARHPQRGASPEDDGDAPEQRANPAPSRPW